MSRMNGECLEPNSLLSVQPTEEPELSSKHGAGSTRSSKARCENTTASYESGRTLVLTLHKVHKENGIGSNEPPGLAQEAADETGDLLLCTERIVSN